MEKVILFLNSNMFIGFSTILTGTVAIGIFIRRRMQEKRDAARIILMEIRNAESKIKEIRSSATITDFTSVLPNNSWPNYSHLFAQDLDRDELDLVNSFFSRSTLVEREVNKFTNSLTIAMEEKEKLLQAKLIELANEGKTSEEYETKKNKLLEIAHNEGYYFSPTAPLNKITGYLQDFPLITSSNIGRKLKKIADME